MHKRFHKLLILFYNIIEKLKIPNLKRRGFNIPWHQFTRREKTALNVLSNYNDNIHSLLNIGFHNWEDKRNHWWIKICNKNNINWVILEIFKNNIIQAINKGCPKNNIFEGNILEPQTYKNFDCILFWHGPEHIEKKTFINKLPNIEKKANKIIIFGMPDGEEIQGAIYGNKFEEHISSWDVKDWEELGYKTIVVNDRTPGHITAYKIFN
tara:strand:+ start:6605 stop:7234 length:630 start_codon:yes stop_codon:yes gene_type:complete